MNDNYFSNMSDEELVEFYGLWHESAKAGMMKQDKKVTDAMDYYNEISKIIPGISCERDMLYEIAYRWLKLN